MTERERWIVYPLLFLAISASLKDKFAGTSDAAHFKTLRVDQLLEVGQIRSHLAEIRELHTRGILVEDSLRRPKIALRALPLPRKSPNGIQESLGRVTLFGPKNLDLVTLSGSPNGGLIVTRSENNRKAKILYGYHPLGSGLVWFDEEGKPKQLFGKKMQQESLQKKEETESEGEKSATPQPATPPTDTKSAVQ